MDSPRTGSRTPEIPLFAELVRLSALAGLAAVFFLTVLLPSGAVATEGQSPLSALGRDDAVLLAGPDGGIFFAQNRHRKLIPASSLKVLTALAAIWELGPDYRFPTEFYLTKKKDLLIKGYGDPMLVSEIVRKIAGELSRRVKEVENVLVDGSYFKQPIAVAGVSAETLQPYNAPNAALCVNFNTVAFVKKNGRIASAEPQTPMLPAAVSRIREVQADSGRILLSDKAGESMVYAGQLFAYFMEEAGIAVKGRIRPARGDTAGARLLYRHAAEDKLTGIIEKLFQYSNNFIANQLLLATGAAASGPPATLEKGVGVLYAGCRQKLHLKGIRLVEGSGISRKNRVSAEMFNAILKAFAPYYELMPRKKQIYSKTGTLDGIRTEVGYIRSEQQGLFRFAILLNTPGKKTGPILAALQELVP
ncbi:MAG: D-alanyl-D-alanine carboxypeptidase [Desulfosalsimonadaceae bacterium]